MSNIHFDPARTETPRTETIMKTSREIHEELRHRILALPGVTERPRAGIHEDAFFVGRTMFMHIHGHGHCDIQLPMDLQKQVLAEGKARPHRWAPEKGYVTSLVKDEKALGSTMELIRQAPHNAVGASKNLRQEEAYWE